jgi:protein SCO1/2
LNLELPRKKRRQKKPLFVKKIFYIIALIVAVTGVSLQLWLTKLSQERATVLGGAPEKVQFRDYSKVPDFTFTDRTGKAVSLADLKGKVWLANFIYTTCPTTCSMLSNRLAGLQKAALALGNGDVRLVSFTVNPEQDTPERLQGYATAFKAEDDWLFLTGKLDQIEKVAKEGFLIGFQVVPDIENEIAHSTKIAVVDRNGVVRAFYDGVGENDETPRILKDLIDLLKEDAGK